MSQGSEDADREDKDTSHDALHFALPFLKAAGPRHYQRATSFALMCWNIGLLPEHGRQEIIQELVKMWEGKEPLLPDDKEDRQLLLAWAQRLIARKINEYGHRKRYIVTHTVTLSGDTLTLTTGTVGLECPQWRLN